MTAPAKSGPTRDTPPKPAPPPPPAWRPWLLPIGLLITTSLLFIPVMTSPAPPQRLAYSDLLNQVNAGHVTSVSINNLGAVTGRLDKDGEFTSQIPTALTTGTSDLQQTLLAHHVTITGKQSSNSALLNIALSFLPLLLIIGLFVWSGRAARRSLGAGIGGIGRSRAKITDAERPTTRFSDVAGYDGAKEEITEVVDFLRTPDRYAKAGAVGPRGVLMVGPPGTGKTLLARAVAGEADVPFLSITGSGFVELFVGVGASRVRDLFADARKRSPAIIFIDEIDAIGGRRGGSAFATNDEREQTLNQLLAEMDGFDKEADVVVLAATNRPETLDPALVRPGRFDRQVVVPLPNQVERAEILRVHACGKNISRDVDLNVSARATPGFSGADLANLLNEAAINVVRADRDVIDAADLDAARDRILLGRRDASNALLPEERRSVAVHEAGHALVAALSPHADPVAKVTILPAGMALGVTEQLPEAERHLYTEGYLTDTLAVRLGGRAAELIALGEGSTGASNDLAGATQLATRMVVEFGLSAELGPVSYSTGTPEYLGPGQPQRPYSEETQRSVDREVARLLRDAEQTSLELLRTHRDALDRLTEMLLTEETVDGSVVLATLGDNALLPTLQPTGGN
ncbi:MAG: ATP-dependent zinc metalloprotease FtsH [Solirubrobacteraceae bacterium]